MAASTPEGEQRLRLRGEGDALGVAVEVERLDSEPVAPDDEPSAARVPQCETEHAIESLQALDTPLLVGVQYCLSVAVVGLPLVAT